ncbi:MAG: ice-binding family protein [Patescibacteria group bacterium]|jgi:hypothetical protein
MNTKKILANLTGTLAGIASGALIFGTLVMPMNAFARRSYANTKMVNLETAADFVILSETGISTIGVTKITGNIGVSPIAASAITGLELITDESGQFSTTTPATGKVYTADHNAPTPTMLITAVSDMQTAYADAAGRVADVTELGNGDIGDLEILPGVYKWSADVIIPTDVTLSGGRNDIWIFQIAGNLAVGSGQKVILSGGAQAKNIFWVVAGTTTLGTRSMFNGTILGKANIALPTNSVLNGRALTSTAVTLDDSTVR